MTVMPLCACLLCRAAVAAGPRSLALRVRSQLRIVFGRRAADRCRLAADSAVDDALTRLGWAPDARVASAPGPQ